MKPRSTLFLQAVILFIAILTSALMIWVPLTEGRAEHLDLFSIYSDPFILYVYAASIPFFVALYKAFVLLGHIRHDRVFSHKPVMAVRRIKHCAIILSILIVAAGIYIRIFHAKDDDPAGFLAMCIVATFVSIVVAVVAAVFENILQHGLDIKLENERTHPKH